MITICAICGASHFRPILERKCLPVFQNVVYDTKDEAMHAPSAPFALSTCGECGFSFNSKYDDNLIVYDARYNNDVVSRVFEEYYRTLAAMLISRFSLYDGYVYDVGCGSGGFLRILCEMSPGIRGVGIDPSCNPTSDNNLTLIRDSFKADYFNQSARLVILRHVLEHIHQPVQFLAALRAAINQAPLFVEVPDLDWIINHGAFWDFCYEHCNYFTLGTLRSAASAASFEIMEQQRSFGDQYQWAICRAVRQLPQRTFDAAQHVCRALGYAETEASRLQDTENIAKEKSGIVLWGMATKGVILSNLISHECLRGGVDMNSRKQGRFAPISGLEIHPPQWLCTPEAGQVVLVMNPNYRDEIAKILRATGIEVELLCV